MQETVGWFPISLKEIVYKLLLYWCVCRGKEDFICHLADFTLLGRMIVLTTLNFAHYEILMEKVVFGGTLIFRILIINDLNYFNFIDIFFISFR